MKKLFKVSALVLGLGLSFSQGASAGTTFDMGTWSETNGSWSNTFNDTNSISNSFGTDGSFTDTWSFSLSSSESLYDTFTGTGMFVAGGNVNSFSGYLSDSKGNKYDFISSGDVNNQYLDLPTSIPTVLTSGSYSIVLSGNILGGNGGSYDGSLLTLTAPVPEPEEWAMMLLGLPLMGWVARRKKNLVQSTSMILA